MENGERTLRLEEHRIAYEREQKQTCSRHQEHEAVQKEMGTPIEIHYWAQQPQAPEEHGLTVLKPVEGE